MNPWLNATSIWHKFGLDSMLSKLESIVSNYPNVMALIRTFASVAAVGLLIYLNT
jgi:hypothetical protein